MASDQVSELLKSMHSVDKSSLTLEQRLDLARAAQVLLAEMERPWDTIIRTVWTQPALYACLRTLVDLKFFEAWEAAGGGEKKSAELGAMVGCDPLLIERLLRHLATSGLLTNPGPHTYGLTEFSRSLAKSTQGSAFRYLYDINLPTYNAMPSYLAHEGYKNPVGKVPASCTFNWAKNFRGALFDYFAQHPSQNEDFGNCMKGVSSSITRWVDQYPTEKLFDGDSSDVVVVDMGGSTGHDLNAFRQKHPTASGKLVLQDLPHVIASSQVEDGITTMAHDFFTPQPVKGARAYYLHFVLHDWPDDKAQEILKMLLPALTKGKSKVLIHEIVLWPQGNAQFASASDIMMLTACNSGERTIEMWKELVEPVGYKVSEVYPSPSSPQSVIELEVA